MPPEDSNISKVVLIDDDLEFIRLVGESLEILGCESFLFSDARDAIEAVRRDRISLVITDYHMEELTGLDVIMAVKQINAQIPVIVISGNLQKEIETAALNCGAYAFLTKPLDIEKLFMVAARII